MATAYAQAPTTVEYLQMAAPPAVLIEIARCESGTRQFAADGTMVLRGDINQHDVGLFQINEHYWQSIAHQLGYDIYTSRGNIQMALWIYKERGTKDWNASKKCWGTMTKLAPAGA